MTNYQHLIGISGKMGHGKDLVAIIIQLLTWQKRNTNYLLKKQGETGEDYLGLIEVSDAELAEAALNQDVYKLLTTSSNNPWRVKRFSHGVKVIGSLLTGIPIEQFEDQEFKKKTLGPEWTINVPVWTSARKYNAMPVDQRPPGDKWIQMDSGQENHIHYRQEPMTVREMLQRVGTEAMRNNLHPDVWVNMLFADWKTELSANSNPPTSKRTFASLFDEYGGEAKIRLAGWQPSEEDEDTWQQSTGVGLDVLTEWPTQHWIVTDVRFPNEKAAIEKHGGLVIRVVRSGVESTSNHPSETSLDNATFEVIIHNEGTVEELVQQVRGVLLYYGIL